MIRKMNLSVITATSLLFVATTLTTIPSQASEEGAFIGGIMAARVGANMRARTEAEQQQAAAAQQQAYAQPVQQAAPAPAAQTPEERIAQLDKLAAGGYITPAEYKAKKQAIIDSM